MSKKQRCNFAVIASIPALRRSFLSLLQMFCRFSKKKFAILFKYVQWFREPYTQWRYSISSLNDVATMGWITNIPKFTSFRKHYMNNLSAFKIHLTGDTHWRKIFSRVRILHALLAGQLAQPFQLDSIRRAVGRRFRSDPLVGRQSWPAG
jgi:hypothetical protein